VPNDYINPTAVRPQYAWQPSSGLAGMAYSQDRRRYDDVSSLQDLMMSNQAQLSLEDVVQGAPVRQAERTAKLKDLPATSRQLEANTRKAELGIEFEEAMQPGKIRLGQGEQGLAQGQQGIARVIQAIAQAPEGPDYIARVGAAAREAGVPANHPVLQDILNVSSPKEAQAKARAFLQQQSNVDQPYRTTMDKTRMEGNYSLRRQELANEGAVNAASIRAQAKNKSAVDMLRQAKDPIQSVTAAMAVINDPEIDPQIRQQAVQIYNASLPAYQRMLQRGIPPQIPNFPQTPNVQMPQYGEQPGGGAQPTHRYNPATRKVEPIR
jgi:hypothetical protein